MNYLLFFIWIMIFTMNAILCIANKKIRLLSIISFIFIGFLICGHHYVGNGDNTDLFYYARDYNSELVTIQDSIVYYLFIASQKIALLLSFSFYQWWIIMTVITLCIILYTAFKFSMNDHFVVIVFMFYIIALYTGLKYYYGFCFMFLALNYFFRNNKKDLLKFIVLTFIASGIHGMYYFFFLLLLIRPKKFKEKLFLRVFAISYSVLILLILIFDTEGILEIINNTVNYIFRTLDISRGVYFDSRTKLGFVIPIALHLVSFIYSCVYYNSIKVSNNTNLVNEAKLLYLTNMFFFVLYPLFFFAITFSRYYTVLSLITLCISSKGFMIISKRDRNILLLCGITLVITFSLYFYGVCNYFNSNLIPLFDNYYL